MKFDNEKHKTSINFDIKTYDIDIAGHVSNIVYIKWLEVLRFKLFEKFLPIDKLLKEDLYPVVISTNIIYKKQLKLLDNPSGFIWIENIQHNMIFLKFRFMTGNNICAFAEQKCILMNLKKDVMDKVKLKTLVV